ncbi:AMP-binding protein [Paenibacillus endoradicis]|uniref:AMP-binding protein n=1 Tax=Paenibacillus endoradicis TaxID=2972487 RepID=UPI002158BBAC|nr:AMP-binding protein [Paenibacillus endoradicis]MCR8656462.1 AMP-binding protein [Paenibacillus endoradicis]
MNLVEPLLQYAAQQPNKIALSDGIKCQSYSNLVRKMKKVARGLIQNGLTRDNVAILSSNRMEFVEVFLGTIYAGCVPIPIDPKWSTNDISIIMQQCEPKVIFTETEFANKLVMQDSDVQRLTFSDDDNGSYDNWLHPLKPEATIDESNELLFIGFTSGTTGAPKGYLRTHSSWFNSVKATSEAFQLNNLEQILAPGPFVHSLSLFALMQSLHSGSTFHIVKDFNSASILQLCKEVPDMILFVVPTMIESMMQQGLQGKTHIQAIISSGGKWSDASKIRCSEFFNGAKLYEFYGSSEASYISYLDIDNKDKYNSVGKPFSGVQISIRDEQFQEVTTGIIGQLYIRSNMMFAGYHKMPEVTTAAFRDGWLIIGDYMYTDEDGYLYLAGRAHNKIVSGGLNIYPEEIETVLLQIPEIEEVIVIGIADEYWGEQVISLIKWNGQQRLTLANIKKFCRQHLAKYKAPKQIITVDQFIYTSSGKIARQAMKEYTKRVML